MTTCTTLHDKPDKDSN